MNEYIEALEKAIEMAEILVEKGKLAADHLDFWREKFQQEEERAKELLLDQELGDRAVSVGSFEVASGEVLVTDPCYTEERSWTRLSVKNGVWKAAVFRSHFDGSFGSRPAELHAYHEQHLDDDLVVWNRGGFMDVDSGQGGIFDASSYPTSEPTRKSWYEQLIDITCYNDFAGAIEGGCVSSSGFGDGSYKIFSGSTEGGTVVAIRIQFVECRGDNTIVDRVRAALRETP